MRALLVVIASMHVASAAPPSGYQCAPGKPNKGVGCTCPADHAERRDDANIATCAPKPKQPQPQGSYDELVRKADRLAESSCAQAEPIYRKALEDKPTGVEAHTGLGYCALDRKDYAQAHSKFRAALAVLKTYEPALWGVADAYRLEGQRDAAEKAVRAYLAVYPGTPKATKLLERLAGAAPAPAAPCDFDAAVKDGDKAVSTGTHAAALSAYKQALKCRADDLVVQKAFLSACAAKLEADAKAFFKQLPAAKQNYFAQVCLRYGIDPSSSNPSPPPAARPDALDRDMISEGMMKVKAKVTACGDKSSAKGTVKVSVTVGANGSVTNAAIKEAPDQALGACVVAVVRTAVFSPTRTGGAFAYPFQF